MVYAIDSGSYLSRAKARILDNSRESLFYAAYELRCCIEARQEEYLQAQRDYAKSIPKSWNIGKQHAALESIFSSERIQSIAINFTDHAKIEALHIPVSTTLRQQAERLGDLLHAQTTYRAESDVWWSELRDRLMGIYRSAWTCNQSKILCPVMLVGEKSIGKIVFSLEPGEARIVQRLASEKRSVIMQVTYLTSPPVDWKCDL